MWLSSQEATPLRTMTNLKTGRKRDKVGLLFFSKVGEGNDHDEYRKKNNKKPIEISEQFILVLSHSKTLSSPNIYLLDTLGYMCFYYIITPTFSK